MQKSLEPKEYMNKIELMYSAKQGQILKANVLTRIASIIDHGQFIQGPEVTAFEKQVCEFTNSKHAIGCANGTDALTIALMAVDLKEGEIVFTPSFTYVATAEAISILRGIPYFVDIDPNTYNISVESLETGIKDAINKGYKIRAVISVDLFGNPANYKEISAVASKYGITHISDAAQSFGARYQGSMVGSLADITTTSFFPTKPLGCYGDGGMIFTQDSVLASKIRSICFHGKGNDKYHHIQIGMNSRLDTIQAAILLEKMLHFEQELEARNQLANFYNHKLNEKFSTPKIVQDERSAWAVYTLRHQKRDEIISYLTKQDIPSNVYYRTPLHLQPAYQSCLKSPNLEHSIKAAKEVFCLPMHGYVTKSQAQYIVETLLSFSDS